MLAASLPPSPQELPPREAPLAAGECPRPPPPPTTDERLGDLPIALAPRTKLFFINWPPDESRGDIYLHLRRNQSNIRSVTTRTPTHGLYFPSANLIRIIFTFLSTLDHAPVSHEILQATPIVVAHVTEGTRHITVRPR